MITPMVDACELTLERLQHLDRAPKTQKQIRSYATSLAECLTRIGVHDPAKIITVGEELASSGGQMPRSPADFAARCAGVSNLRTLENPVYAAHNGAMFAVSKSVAGRDNLETFESSVEAENAAHRQWVHMNPHGAALLAEYRAAEGHKRARIADPNQRMKRVSDLFSAK